MFVDTLVKHVCMHPIKYKNQMLPSGELIYHIWLYNNERTKTKSINEFDMIWNYLTLVVYDEKSIHVCHVIGTEQTFYL